LSVSGTTTRCVPLRLGLARSDARELELKPFRRTLVVLVAVSIVLAAALAVAWRFDPTRGYLEYLWARVRGGHTVEERVRQFGARVDMRLRPAFDTAGVRYPPHEVSYVAFKDAMALEVHARDAATSPWQLVKRYPVLGASGGLGPKLAEGDMQVPEGIYRAQSLNANSRFHLSIRLDYPNAHDQQWAQQDGRQRLGGDIMIHGSNVSIGCLAMGDEAAEDLFVLSALVGQGRTRIIVSPTDFRLPGVAAPTRVVTDLYAALRVELGQFTAAPLVRR
jgi:hypothetical protein